MARSLRSHNTCSPFSTLDKNNNSPKVLKSAIEFMKIHSQFCVVIHQVIMTSPGGASRYYEVNYVLIPYLLIQTGLSRGIWSMPKSDISISAELVISRHGISNEMGWNPRSNTEQFFSKLRYFDVFSR